MKSGAVHTPLQSRGEAPGLRARAEASAFASHCPEDKVFRIEDLMAFRRGRGDLIFSGFMVLLALFFLAAFWTQTGWQDRNLPDEFGTYLLRQLGLADGEGRLARFGRILRQSWVAPAVCLAILVPAALLNFRTSLTVHRWRTRFRQPVAMGHEIRTWGRALEFVLWFMAYTALVPVLGYLIATLVFGTALPWRMGYRSPRWIGIAALTSLIIVLVFRTGLQIRTPVNIWLYNQLPTEIGGFMKTWF